MLEARRVWGRWGFGLLVGWVLTGGLAEVCGQTLPGLGSAPKATEPVKPVDKPVAAPTRDNPDATVATVAGPIKTDKPVDDKAVEETLENLLPKYPGVRTVDATVKQGIVELDGQVEDDDVRDQMTQVAMQVEGVRMVINRLKSDAQVLTAPELVMSKFRGIWDFVSRRWLLAVLALLIALGCSMLARVFNTYSETLLAPFVKNMLLRSVLGSLIGTLLLLGGLLIGLQVLNLTHAVLSIVGLAGVVGLALGFAFRDIAENFIASLLLGVRRPFRMGDYVSVAGQEGVVRSLNTRATVLVTLDGKHVRIPNNVIYKEILVNSSASPNTRSYFDVIVPYDVSTATALDAMTRALRDVEGVIADPPARALVEALETVGVRLRAYYWSPVMGVDGYKLNSDARLKVKVALQKAGIMPPPTNLQVSVLGKVRLQRAGINGEHSPVHRSGAVVSPEQAAANLRRDTHAADNATAETSEERPTPIEHALNEAETRVSEEGTNLLAGAGNKSGSE
jgi:small conductance mechanosensitive channel